MNLVLFFDQPQAGFGSLVGGKGSNLHVLSAAGFPVPPGFVVTAAAYDEFLTGAAWLDEELTAFDFDNPERLRDQCSQLRARLVRVDLPVAVVQAIHAAMARIAGG